MILDIIPNPAPPTIHLTPVLGSPKQPFLKLIGQDTFLSIIGRLSLRFICFNTSSKSIFSK